MRMTHFDQRSLVSPEPCATEYSSTLMLQPISLKLMRVRFLRLAEEPQGGET
jgi:hypothetical protein